jgi:hypothetical protein
MLRLSVFEIHPFLTSIIKYFIPIERTLEYLNCTPIVRHQLTIGGAVTVEFL